MTTSAVDHVNILTTDLETTVAFYEQALELTRGQSPIAQAGRQGAWMFDDNGNAIVHLVVHDGTIPMYDDHEVGKPTNAVHHVAFRCQGFRAAIDRIKAMGIEPKINDGMLGLHQIFLVDPNGVNVEMNYHEGQ